MSYGCDMRAVPDRRGLAAVAPQRRGEAGKSGTDEKWRTKLQLTLARWLGRAGSARQTCVPLEPGGKIVCGSPLHRVHSRPLSAHHKGTAGSFATSLLVHGRQKRPMVCPAAWSRMASSANGARSEGGPWKRSRPGWLRYVRSSATRARCRRGFDLHELDAPYARRGHLACGVQPNHAVKTGRWRGTP